MPPASRDIPSGWILVPPGDSALTRRLKKGEHKLAPTSKYKKREISGGVWASPDDVNDIKKDLERERSTDAYRKQLESGRQYREKKQEEYVDEFTDGILKLLNFHSTHDKLAKAIATRISKHATPVGSGTVARTKLIDMQERISKAVFAWLRHALTDYDNTEVKHKKGARNKVRKSLKKKNKLVLDRYRKNIPILPSCPLQLYLKGLPQAPIHNSNVKNGSGSERKRNRKKKKKKQTTAAISSEDNVYANEKYPNRARMEAAVAADRERASQNSHTEIVSQVCYRQDTQEKCDFIDQTSDIKELAAPRKLETPICIDLTSPERTPLQDVINHPTPEQKSLLRKRNALEGREMPLAYKRKMD